MIIQSECVITFSYRRILFDSFYFEQNPLVCFLGMFRRLNIYCYDAYRQSNSLLRIGNNNHREPVQILGGMTFGAVST